MLVVVAIALASFAGCSFYVSHISERIRDALKQRHAMLLTVIAPTVSSSWMAHWSWQYASNVVFAALPLLGDVADEPLMRDVTRFKIGCLLALAAWIVFAVSATRLFVLR